MSKWSKKKIKDFAFTASGGTPSTERKEYWHNGTIPWINSGELSKHDIIKKPTTYITQEALDNSSAKLFPIGTVVIALTGATTGMSAILEIETSTNQSITGIFPSKEHDSKFLLYTLHHNIDKILLHNVGSAQPHINKEIVDNLEFNYPIVPEQYVISKILSTADAVIEKTQAAIAKYKAIKQGMLQDLFTRGIDLNTNKLRPRYEDAPELYKDSKLGMIPREWEAEKIGKIFRFNQGVQCPVELQKLHQGENEVRFIRIIDLTNDSEPPRYITDPGSQYHLNSNDLFMVRYGSPGLVGYGYEGVIANNLFRIISTGELEVLNSFYRYYLTSINDKLTALSASTTMPAINFDSLNKLHVIYPQLSEQEEIEKRIKAMDNKLQTEQTYLQKMQSLKKGLMEDLLSGRKQVKVAEEVLTQSEN